MYTRLCSGPEMSPLPPIRNMVIAPPESAPAVSRARTRHQYCVTEVDSV